MDNRRFESIRGTWVVDPSFAGSNTQHQIRLEVYPPMFSNELPANGDRTFPGSITYKSTCNALADLGVDSYIAEGKNRINVQRRSKRGALLALYDMIGFFTEAYSVSKCQQNPTQIEEVHRIIQWFTNSQNNRIPRWFRDACVQRQGNYPMYGIISSEGDWNGSYICVNHFDQTAYNPKAIEVLLSGLSSSDSSEWIRFFKQ